MAQTTSYRNVRFFLACLLMAAVTSAGCSRTWYRLDADEVSTGLIEQKSAENPQFASPTPNIYMDPRSRYYNPHDPDNEPMPRDDPASHQYMDCVYCMDGYAHWHDDGEVDEIENPQWREYLDQSLAKTEDGNYLLTVEDAVRLAYMHSPDYQEQLENLYLSSMDLAFERFRFDVQFFGGNNTDFRHNGSLRSAFGGETNTLTTSSNLRATKLFAAGGELLVGFANSFMWQFAGPDSNQATSLLNFSLVQPLLRQGGRDVVLERLTVSERTLLANLRAMGRYRKMFYLNVSVGDFAFGGPIRRGGFLGGAGLTGFTGTQGGFGGVGQATQFGRFGFGGQDGGGGGGGGAFVAAVAGPQGGIIGLVQQRQQLRNQEATLQNLLREQERMEANFEAGRIDALQVDQFRASVQSQLSDLIRTRNNLQGEIDQYLTQTLGLPPDLPVDFDDSYVRQFQFFDPSGIALDQQLTGFTAQLRALGQPTRMQVQQSIATAAELRAAVVARIETVQEDFDMLDARLEQRLNLITDEQEQTQFHSEMEELRQSFEQIQRNIAASDAALRATQDPMRAGDPVAAVNALVEFVDSLSDRLIELSLVQARARLESVVIETVDINADEALAVAQEHRLDWMNQRAALVDQWRLIAFVADRLESDLDIVFTGDVSTRRDNPLDFRAATGSLAVGLRFDAPLTRISERNQYRDVLVDYQRARRDYIGFRDFVKRNLRQHLRNLQQGRETLELQRKQFVINMRQFDFSRLQLREPPPPAAAGQLAVPTFGPTLARNLLDALTGLLTAQNNVMNVWVQYETTRQQLMRDMGIMQVDENGMIVDVDLQAYVDAVRAGASADVIPPDLAEELEILPDMFPLENPEVMPSEVRLPDQRPELREVLLEAGATPEELASARVLATRRAGPIRRIVRGIGGSANRPARLREQPDAPAAQPLMQASLQENAPAIASGPQRSGPPSDVHAPRAGPRAARKSALPWRKRFRRMF